MLVIRSTELQTRKAPRPEYEMNVLSVLARITHSFFIFMEWHKQEIAVKLYDFNIRFDLTPRLSLRSSYFSNVLVILLLFICYGSTVNISDLLNKSSVLHLAWNLPHIGWNCSVPTSRAAQTKLRNEQLTGFEINVLFSFSNFTAAVFYCSFQILTLFTMHSHESFPFFWFICLTCSKALNKHTQKNRFWAAIDITYKYVFHLIHFDKIFS